MDFEKLGAFYLGREVDPDDGATTDQLLLYEARDLTTHGVIVGMTGSGKTGLGMALIEEAAMDRIPVLAIDPKGDLANLALTFPELRPEDFEPWVDPGAAAQRGLDVGAFAADQARRWREGLERWGQGGARIRALREAAEVRVYTPGSSAGRPLSILRSFARPDEVVMRDPELLGERLAAAAGSLLSLVGRNGDPASREHVLLAAILEQHWRAGRDVTLADLVLGVQTPPLTQVGVLDLDTFYPASERVRLATALNSVLASPSFATWLAGDPMDVARLFTAPDGRPRVSIVSIAHLGDAERQMVMALLLTEVLAWMRAQSGTGSLRALLYVDELFGFMPPVANPPSKPPLLTLLKQARAFGLGVVLATQNPVDLDYRGLSNAGTWFIGRLQTERDKARLLDGLRGAAEGRTLDAARLGRLISGLGQRVFLLHSVHDREPVLFTTRWVMSYMAGPLTRDQIRRLAPEAGDGAAAVTHAAPSAAHRERPALPPDVPQRFVVVQPGVRAVTYFPAVLGVADVRYVHASLGVDVSERVARWVEPSESMLGVDWAAGDEVVVDLTDLADAPLDDASFEPLPIRPNARSLATWTQGFTRHLRGDRPLSLWRHRGLGLVSEPGEREGDFRARLRHAQRERQDAAREKLRGVFERRAATLEARMRRAEQTVARQEHAAQQKRLDAAITVGTALLGSFLGRRTPTATRMSTAMRSVNRASGTGSEVERARQTMASVAAELRNLEAQLERDLEAIAAAEEVEGPLETVAVRPKSSDVHVLSVVLAWRPFARDEAGRWVDVSRAR